MATLNEYTFYSGSNFEWHFWSQWHEFYLYTAVSEEMSTTNKNEWQNEHFETNKTTNQNHSLFKNKHMSHVTIAAGIDVFWSQKMRALSREQIVQ